MNSMVIKGKYTQNLLHSVIANPVVETDFLDMLSQLEYVGCRKILSSVSFDRVDKSVLQHISEEALHAFLLKSVVEKRGLPERSYENNPYSEFGWKYFQALDQGVSGWQKNRSDCYPAVSWIVEQRVLDLYSQYVELTPSLSVKKALKTILAQEERHEKVMDAFGFSNDAKTQMLAEEEKLWDWFCLKMLDTISLQSGQLDAPQASQLH